MQIGEPYTFIRSEPILKADGQPLGAGDYLSKWFRTSEPGRVFPIDGHPVNTGTAQF